MQWEEMVMGGVEGTAMVGEGDSCKKDLQLIGKEFLDRERNCRRNGQII